jgi:hypothetical protein
MELIKTIGNIKVFYVQNAEKDFTINLYNGSDCIYSEVYFSNLDYAIRDSLQKACDIYTFRDLSNMQIITKRLTNNTLVSITGDGTGKQDYFCRIDDTEYFKHYFKAAEEFIKDKNGNKIVDR